MRKIIAAALIMVSGPAHAQSETFQQSHTIARERAVERLLVSCEKIAALALQSKLDGVSKSTALRINDEAVSGGSQIGREIIELVYATDIQPDRFDFQDTLINMQLDVRAVCREAVQ